MSFSFIKKIQQRSDFSVQEGKDAVCGLIFFCFFGMRNKANAQQLMENVRVTLRYSEGYI